MFFLFSCLLAGCRRSSGGLKEHTRWKDPWSLNLYMTIHECDHAQVSQLEDKIPSQLSPLRPASQPAMQIITDVSEVC